MWREPLYEKVEVDRELQAGTGNFDEYNFFGFLRRKMVRETIP
jgi:hypothetical protein